MAKPWMVHWDFVYQLLELYVITMILVYLTSPLMIFLPPRPATYEDDEHIIKLTTDNGKRISAKYHPHPEAEYTLLYSHGNAEDLGFLDYFLQAYHHAGFSVFAYDYQGYGTSDGWVSEGHTYQDIRAAYHYLVNEAKISPEKIILIGHSLGSGPSVDLAAELPVGGLFLESPLLSAYRVVTKIPLFPVDRFRNINKAPKVTAPIWIIHGTKDKVVPFYHGKTLIDYFPGPKKFIPIEGAGHNDLTYHMGTAYWETIREFMQFIADKAKKE